LTGDNGDDAYLLQLVVTAREVEQVKERVDGEERRDPVADELGRGGDAGQLTQRHHRQRHCERGDESGN
jgi:hypothetical protein